VRVTLQHLATFLTQSVFDYRVHDTELEYLEKDDKQDIVINLSAGCATGIEEMELLVRLFKSTDMSIPAWETINVGCATCGDGSLSKLDGLTIRDVCPLEETLYEAGLIRWEQELDRLERERLQQIAHRQEQRERAERKKRHLADAKRKAKLKEQQEELFENNLDSIFEQLWAVYEPLLDMNLNGRDFHERTLGLPQVVRKLFFILRKTKPEHQNYGGLKRKFIECCERKPTHMMRTLFPEGKQIALNYRCLRVESDRIMRPKQRQLELEGFIVF